MKKFINSVDRLIEESLSGFGRAQADLVEVHFNPTFVKRKGRPRPKVAVISGGGSGHEPLHVGFVGAGMLDAACPGQVFTSPRPDQMIAAAHAVNGGRGILFIVKNYPGDSRDFHMASEMLEIDNVIAMVDDDVTALHAPHMTGRRGVAGTVLVEKVVGAAAEEGWDLHACKALAERVNKVSASMGVALTSCVVPAGGRPSFEIADNEIEVGVGLHGEPGRSREPLQPADAIVADLIDAILSDLAPRPGTEVLLFINGFGATPLIEQYLLFDSAARCLDQAGLKVTRSLVGTFATALEMAGASVTVCLLDREITRFWDAPVCTPALRRGL
ncbi:MAG: dihydroxyacetone kinase subunit DhaK [Azospirillaceae bacterium]|nr:dihydroxyacetone kinase subunit DhaK [Azospirillaceae bacterium]